MAKNGGNGKGRSGKDANKIPTEVASSIAEAMIELDEIAKKRYQLSLEELTSETDRTVAAKCMRHLVGVVIKKDIARRWR